MAASWLVDNRGASPLVVPAQIVSDLSERRLREVEGSWRATREELRAIGAPSQHDHWSWTNKAPRVRSGETRIVSVECEGDAQGLMALLTSKRTLLPPLGQSLVYVDFLEAAPWNLRAHTSEPRFLGVGKSLLGAAIRMSLDLG
jgi:hypothetical protein